MSSKKFNFSPTLFLTILLLFFTFFPKNTFAANTTLHVGSGQTYALISSALANSLSGDTIILHNDIIENNIAINIGITIIGDGVVKKSISTTSGGRIFYINTPDSVTLRNLNINEGYLWQGDGPGAGILVEGATHLAIENCTIGSNTVNGADGGGVCITDSASVKIDSTIISNNSSSSCSGGGIAVISNKSSLEMNDCEINNNIANDYRGGGIYTTGTTNLTQCIIDNNDARHGGGLYTVSEVTLSNCRISNNTSYVYGGGGLYANSGSLNITGSTFSGNFTYVTGGGLYLEGGNYTIENSTIAGNHGSNMAGGISIEESTLDINCCTICNNTVGSADQTGGIYIHNNCGSININNTILVNNDNEDIYSYSSTVLTNCLFGIRGPSNIYESNCIVTSDAQLLGLALNDNPNGTYTLAINRLSLARNAADVGSALSSDQRGFARNGLPDIGAYEWQDIAAPTVQSSDFSANNLSCIQADISWVSGNGERRLILAKAGSLVDADPVDGYVYTANTIFGSGSQIGDGNYVVGNTDSSAITVTGLNPDSIHYFAIYELNNIDDPSYLTPALTGAAKRASTITTQAVSDISEGTAIGNGNITDLGAPRPMQHGMCWNISPDPDINDNKTDEGIASATGGFTSTLIGLNPYTTYYVRAYAIYLEGISYGEEMSFYYGDGSGIGSMLTFNGSDQYLESDLVTASVDNITMEAWVNWEGQSGSVGILYHGFSASSGYGIMLSASASPSQSITIICGGKGYATSSTQLPINSWHHIATLRDNGTWKLYLDGVEKTLTNTGVVPNIPTNILDIASLSDGTQLFKGSIDEIRMWDIARSQNEIQTSYDPLIGDESGLIGYWRLDEGSGTSAADASGNDKTAQLINTPDWRNSSAPLDDPILAFSSNLLNFGYTAVDNDSSRMISIINNGGSILNINSISIDNGAFTLTPQTATIFEDEVFTVTFSPDSLGEYSGNMIVNHNAAGSPDTISLIGTSLQEPTVPASNILVSNLNKTSLDVSWSNGNGLKRAVFMANAKQTIIKPTDFNTYVANLEYGSGSQIGSSGWYCIYNGTGSAVSMTGLSENTAYDMIIYEYNGSEGWENYNIDVSSNNSKLVLTLSDISMGSGKALAFDGQNDCVSIPGALSDSLAGGTAITIEFWFKGNVFQSPVRIQSDQGYIVAGWGENNPTYIISTDGGTLEGISPGSESTIEDGNWHHCAMVWQKNTVNGFNAYLDGKIVSSRTSADVDLPPFSNAVGYLGSYLGTDEYINGTLDEVRIWNVARSAEEIRQNMCKSFFLGDVNGLLLSYNFNQLSGSTTVTDLCNDLNGSLQNMNENAVWIPSGAPIGTNSCLLQSTIPMQIGSYGQCCSVSLNGTPDIDNYLNLYHFAGESGTISNADIGSWPNDVIARADITWGFHATGEVSADLVFDYSQISDIADPNKIRLIKRACASDAWIDVTNDFVHNILQRTFTKSGVTSFSEYSVGEEEGAEVPLSITLVSFEAEEKNGIVLLKWITESETENAGFIVEKLRYDEKETNLETWERVSDYTADSTLTGHGTTAENHLYQFTDKNVRAGCTYHYRLGDANFDNTITWHEPLEITLKGQMALIPEVFGIQSVYPNPFNPKLTIRYGLTNEAQTTVKILNLRGQIVSILENTLQQAGSYGLQWQADTFPSGIYFIQVISGEKRDLRKVLLVK